MITDETVIIIPECVNYNIADDGAVVLNVQTGKFFGLDKIGTHMWTLLAQHGSLRTVANILLKEYDVAEDRLWKDLIDLVEKLKAKGLVELRER